MFFGTAGAQLRGVKSLAGYLSSFQSTCKCQYCESVLLYHLERLAGNRSKIICTNSMLTTNRVGLVFVFWVVFFSTFSGRDISMGKKCRLLNSAHSCSGHKLEPFLGKALEQALPHHDTELKGGAFWGSTQQRTPGNCLFWPKKYRKILRTHSKSSEQMECAFVMEEKC